jgi:uncharacterized membrane protein
VNPLQQTLYSVKTRSRSLLRQVLLFIAIGALLSAVVLGGHGDWQGPVFAGLVVGPPLGIALWALYRVAKFAVGPISL